MQILFCFPDFILFHQTSETFSLPHSHFYYVFSSVYLSGRTKLFSEYNQSPLNLLSLSLLLVKWLVYCALSRQKLETGHKCFQCWVFQLCIPLYLTTKKRSNRELEVILGDNC